MKGLIEAIEKENLKDSVPAFNVGDTVKVSVKVVEGTRERLQAFEGVVIAKKNGGIRETFTVRRLSYGVGVERTFPVHSPKIANITVVRKGTYRQSGEDQRGQVNRIHLNGKENMRSHFGSAYFFVGALAYPP